jgi:hypothetical protein
MNRDCTIDKSLIYKENLINYKRDRGLQSPERCGDSVIKNNHAESLVKFVQKHFKNNNMMNNVTDPAFAAKQVREVFDII